MTDPTPAMWSSCHQAADVDALDRVWHLVLMIGIAQPGRVMLAVALLLAGSACRSPAPAAPAPTPIVTVALPATSPEVHPSPSPNHRRGTACSSSKLSSPVARPNPPCPAGQAAWVLVTGEDEGPRMAFAEEVGCVARSPVVHGEIQLCRPTGLEALSACHPYRRCQEPRAGPAGVRGVARSGGRQGRFGFGGDGRYLRHGAQSGNLPRLLLR